MLLIQQGEVSIRKMEPCPHDFALFLKWMTDPNTMKYWEGMTEHFTYERVEQEYREHMEENVEQCIISYGQREVGYCQFCLLDAPLFEVPQDQYDRFVAPGELAYGIDILIGEVECRNRGIGTKALIALMQALFVQYHADILMIDPKVQNARAIRCYHKCGFRDLFVVPHRELQDGIYHDSLIMGVKKVAFFASSAC